MIQRALLLCGLVGVLLGTSCGKIGLDADLSRQVTDAIAAISEFNAVADRTPDNLRKAADKVIDKLKFEGHDFLANEAREFVDHTISTGGIVAQGILLYLDEKLKAYMTALKAALEKVLPDIKAEKSRDKAIELLRNIKVDVNPLDPKAFLNNPNKLTLNYLQTHTGKLKGIDYKSPRMVELTGFGFQRPKGEPNEYRVEVVGVKGTRVLPADVVSQSGPFLLLINLSHFTPVEGDRKLLVSWGEKPLADIPFESLVVKDKPPDPPPPLPPHIVALHVRVLTTDDNKDREIRFAYSIHRQSAAGHLEDPIGSTSQGDGQEWPKKDDRTFRIPLEKGKTFPEADRLKYGIHVHYDSTKGDPQWEGQLEVTAEFEGGRTTSIPVLANTGTFPMGHLGDGSGRRDRFFQFNR